MDLDKLSKSDKIVAISGLVLFISSFLSWFTFKVKVPTGIGGGVGSSSTSVNGWHEVVGFLFGPLPALIGLVLAVLVGIRVFAPQVKLPEAPWGIIYIAAAGVAALLVVIELLKGEGTSGGSLLGYSVTSSRSYGIILAAISACVMAFGGYLKFTEAGGKAAIGGPSTTTPTNPTNPTNPTF